MNRQEFIAAHRDARKVFAFNEAMHCAGVNGVDGQHNAVTSLYSEIPDPAWYAANSTLAKSGKGDVLVLGYFRSKRSGKLDRLSLSYHRAVRLPDGNTVAKAAALSEGDAE